MIKLAEYKQNFHPLEIPDPLVKLLEFQNANNAVFSSGFELAVDDKTGIKTWSDKPEFLNAFFPIGQSNNSGSFYAIWRRDGALIDAPIVVFGDEGGVHIVAANLASLLQILTFDAEPMIDHKSVTYYKSTNAKPSARAAEYIEWLAKNSHLKPVNDAKEVEQIVAAAQNLHAKAFETWFTRFHVG